MVVQNISNPLSKNIVAPLFWNNSPSNQMQEIWHKIIHRDLITLRSPKSYQSVFRETRSLWQRTPIFDHLMLKCCISRET